MSTALDDDNINYAALAERLVLASLNDTAGDTLDADIGECAHCWRRVAECLAGFTAEERRNSCGGDDEAVALTESYLAD